MLVLLIMNSAENRLQMVLAQAENTGWSVAACQEWQVLRTIGYAAPGLEYMLSAMQKTAADLTHIACVVGPGGFTGLRLSLSLVEGIAVVGRQPLAGLDYLSLLARPVAASLPGLAFVVTHSRRKQVYFQSFASINGKPEPMCPPVDIKLDALPDLLETSRKNAAKSGLSHNGPIWLLGSGLRRNAEVFHPMAKERSWTILPDTWDTPRPEALVEAAGEAEYSDGPLAPTYLRGSDAEENLEQIAHKRGLDVDQARQLIARGSSLE